jgi:hypothetical protein
MEWPAPPRGSLKLPLRQKERAKAMRITVVGIDLGKNVCSLVGLDGSGQVVFRRRVRREMC